MRHNHGAQDANGLHHGVTFDARHKTARNAARRRLTQTKVDLWSQGRSKNRHENDVGKNDVRMLAIEKVKSSYGDQSHKMPADPLKTCKERFRSRVDEGSLCTMFEEQNNRKHR